MGSGEFASHSLRSGVLTFHPKVNDNSGLIGAAIVGVFVGIVAVFYLSRCVYRRREANTRRVREVVQV